MINLTTIRKALVPLLVALVLHYVPGMDASALESVIGALVTAGAVYVVPNATKEDEAPVPDVPHAD